VAKNRALYQLKVTLRDIQPPIWRRVQVWEDTTLAQLHTILQIVMGWEDCHHLHQLVIGCRLYSAPDPDDDIYERKVIDESRVPLAEVVPRVGTQFTYLYDFGDSWEHDLVLEAILLPEGRRPRSIRPASEASGARPQKTWVELPDTNNTWWCWPTPNTKNIPTCCGGGVRSIRKHSRQPW
jgi:hypothetical protein